MLAFSKLSENANDIDLPFASSPMMRNTVTKSLLFLAASASITSSLLCSLHSKAIFLLLNNSRMAETPGIEYGGVTL